MATRPALEVADIFRCHGEAFRRSHRAHLGRIERRVMAAVEACQGEDATGRVVLRCRLRREAVERYFATLPPAVVGLEACGSAHHWGRVLRAMGHEVRLLPAAYVKPFVRRNKTDARDAAAICHAMRQPDLHPVPLKTVQQAWSGRTTCWCAHARNSPMRSAAC